MTTEYVEELVRLLEDGSGSPRVSGAMEALVKVGAPAVPRLGRVLRDGSFFGQRNAATVLTKISAAAVDELIAALMDKATLSPGLVAMCIASIGSPDAIKAVPVLTATLRDWLSEVKTDDDARRLSKEDVGDFNGGAASAYALGGIGSPAADPAISVLIAALGNVENSARQLAALALWRIGAPAADAAVPDLANVLRDPVADVRYKAANALVNIGSLAVPPMITALSDPEPYVQVAAAYVLGKIGSPAAASSVPALIQLLSTPAPPVASPVARTAREEMINSFKEPGPNPREAAAVALGLIGAPAAVAAIPQLTVGAKDSESVVRIACASALSSIMKN